eukprot:469264-Rhodomonas_salina.2
MQLSLGQLALVLDSVLTSSFADAADGARPVVYECRKIPGKALSVVQLENFQVLGPARVAPHPRFRTHTRVCYPGSQGGTPHSFSCHGQTTCWLREE